MKLKKQFTINLDDDGARLVEYLADIYQRKPAELLRLLLIPELEKRFADVMTQQHPDNKSAWIEL